MRELRELRRIAKERMQERVLQERGVASPSWIGISIVLQRWKQQCHRHVLKYPILENYQGM